MKFFFDGGLQIEMEERLLASEAIEGGTPQYKFLKRRYQNDLSKELSCLKAMLKAAPREEIHSYFDVLAGCGFSARMVCNYLRLHKVRLNDWDAGCVRILKTNFAGAKISNSNANRLRAFKEDLIFLDFNSFTLNSVARWEGLFKTLFSGRSKIVWITDSACYGFKFGNLVSYDCKSEKEYYQRLSDTIRGFGNYGMNCYSRFENAALTSFVPGYKGSIRRLESEPVQVHLVRRRGLLY